MPAAPHPKASLLFVSQFYHPDVAAVSQHLTDLAEFLASRGHDVSVFAAFPAYAGANAPAVAPREVRNGVKIRRFRATAFGRGTHLGRMADYGSFYVQVLLAILLGPRRDGIVFLTTPPLISFAGMIARALRGQRYAIWSMDLHPAAEFAAGMLRERSVAGRMLQAVWRGAQRRADFTIALGPFMKTRLVDAGVDATRVSVVSPWAHADDFAVSSEAVAAYRERLGVRDRFVVMYSGNAGLLHDFRSICEAMRQLRDDASIVFVFIGGGPRRREIERFVAAEALPNVILRGYEDRGDIGRSLAAADVHLISLLGDFAGIAVPSKVFGVMAAARPALYVGPVESEVAQTIVDADCGAVVDPASGGGESDIVSILRRWQSDAAERRRLGINARARFEREFEQSTACARIAQVIDGAWPSSSTAA